MVRLLHVLMLGVFGGGLLAGCGPEAPERSNLVLIVADDLGYGDLGVTGAPDIQTPHLDGLAAEGMRFTRFYANAPVCSPTRAALLSGQYQQRTRVDRVLYADEHDLGLPLDVLLLPEVLKPAGYTTALFGKWHLGYPTAHFPTRQGFDAFVGFVAGNIDYFAHTTRLGEPDLWRGETAIQDERYLTDLIADEALAFLEAHRGEPFFLFLPFSAPHDPWQGPEHRHTAGNRAITVGEHRTRAVYRSMVESMDQNIGRVLDGLDALGLRENTLVVFMSDNGGLPTVARNDPFRGYKGTLWDGGIHAPLLVRGPGIAAGTVSDALSAGFDLFPTLLAWAGVPVPTDRPIDGVSLAPVLRGTQSAVRDSLFFHYDDPRYPPQRALIADGWKYLVDQDSTTHLFHLAEDPAETTDLAADHPERLAAMQTAYERWLAEVSDDRPPLPSR